MQMPLLQCSTQHKVFSQACSVSASSRCARPTFFASFEEFLWPMDVDVPLVRQYFCGFCRADAGSKSGEKGHWQAYSVASTKSWTYLCKGCSRMFWRDFTKLEEFTDHHSRNQEFVLWLGEEFQKKRGWLVLCSHCMTLCEYLYSKRHHVWNSIFDRVVAFIAWVFSLRGPFLVRLICMAVKSITNTVCQMAESTYLIVHEKQNFYPSGFFWVYTFYFDLEGEWNA